MRLMLLDPPVGPKLTAASIAAHGCHRTAFQVTRTSSQV
jgi:hypothetical protein